MSLTVECTSELRDCLKGNIRKVDIVDKNIVTVNVATDTLEVFGGLYLILIAGLTYEEFECNLRSKLKSIRERCLDLYYNIAGACVVSVIITNPEARTRAVAYVGISNIFATRDNIEVKQLAP